MRCCSEGESASSAISAPISEIAPNSWPRRIVALVQWAIPITTLALIPKCPGCVAAYVLLFTGIGVSFTTATALQWGLTVLSFVALGFLALRTAMGAFAFLARRA